jgi:hypothetical protein
LLQGDFAGMSLSAKPMMKRRINALGGYLKADKRSVDHVLFNVPTVEKWFMATCKRQRYCHCCNDYWWRQFSMEANASINNM